MLKQMGVVAAAIAVGTVLTGIGFGFTPATAASKNVSFNKTMRLKTKKCEAVVRGLPRHARITKRDSRWFAKGMLAYGKRSRIQFDCVDRKFTPWKLSWKMHLSTSSQCRPKNAKRLPKSMDICHPWGSTPVPGTNINFTTYKLCGASSGGSSCSNQVAYALKQRGSWILLSIDQSSRSPMSWVVRMLERSTFVVRRGAGGSPYNPMTYYGSPAGSQLPNWLDA